MGIAKRRDPRRREAEHELEKALDAMHATKADRVLARNTFAELLAGNSQSPLKNAVRKALRAVDDTHTGASDTPPRQA